MRLHFQKICTSLKNWFHGIVFVLHFLKETIRWSYSYVHLELVSYETLGSNFTDSEKAFSPVCMWLREVTWVSVVLSCSLCPRNAVCYPDSEPVLGRK